MLAARSLRLGIVAATLGCSIACGSPTSPSGQDLEYVSTHFVFHHNEPDAERVKAIAPIVEAEYGRVVSDLGAFGMRPVHVILYQSHDALAKSVAGVAGPIPSWATGLVTAADRIHLVAPSATGMSDVAAAWTIVHEFAHCATLHLNSNSGNNPRWLWEAIATYEARQQVDPKTLPYLTNGPYPTLADLSVMTDRRIYDVGFHLTEFILSRWDLTALRALIRAAPGDHGALPLEQTLGVSSRDFETEWIAWMRARYGF